ncbi:MAG: hypothetical protein M1832_001432 [Thelocarpon impressellum]|nr:MAG: hypothetical protein M1832_001432 [Thelocarpon impressellum]
MGGQRAGHGSSRGQPPSQQASLRQPSKRRNTVHSTQPPTGLAAAWPASSIPSYAALPPAGFLPLYPPLWQFPQLAALNQTLLLHQAPSPLLPSAHVHVQPPSGQASGTRSTSPRRAGAGRRQTRSPERHGPAGHGHPSQQKRGRGGRPPMTSRDPAVAAMPLHNADLARPAGLQHERSSVSHQSSSVPSTPQQHASTLPFRSRSPSPGGLAALSPRSTHSESNSHLPPLRRPPSGCRFETGMAFSKRRIPYSIGTERLGAAEVAPKKTLPASDERALGRDMRRLYDGLLPTEESETRRAAFVLKLGRMLNDEWPGSDIQVRVFGSSGNLLFTSESDVDICITTPKTELERVCLLANALAENGMERVVCVPSAKVPIVKFWDPELGLACDMNVNNTLALENTRMIKTYVEIDERVRPLAMIIKHWTKRRILNDAALGGTLSSYTWICMIVNFLQTRKPPVLPVLHQRPHHERSAGSPFADDIDALRGFGRPNTDGLGELLFQFFRFYGHEIDYDSSVVSVRQGKLLSKEDKGWHLMQNNSLCVEEPFNVSRNLGNTADETAFRGLHLELRRACSLLSDEADLDACCEQYVFPAEEERIWAKPPPQPKPILSRTGSQSQPGRGGRQGNGHPRGRQFGNQSFRGQNSNRRSSSSASSANAGSAQQPQLALPFQDYRQAQAQLQLHEQLFQSYQALQAREAELRLRQAQAHAQVLAHNQARGEAQSHSASQTPVTYMNGQFAGYPASFENPPLTAPLRQDMFAYPIAYAHTQPHLQHGTNTNPSSPSMSPSLPESRRGLQRSQAPEGSSTASLRSHSQPARPIHSALASHGLSASSFAVNGLGIRTVPHMQDYAAQLGSSGLPDNPTYHQPEYPATGSPPDDGIPKEYLGYYVGGSPPTQRFREEAVLQHVPVFGDLIGRRLMHSPDPRTFDRLQHESRSPSPMGRARTLSDEPRPPTSAASPRANGIANVVRSAEARGPLIVDGSTPSASADPYAQPTCVSESTSASGDLSSDTPATTAEMLYQERFQDDVIRSLQRQAQCYKTADLCGAAERPLPDPAYTWPGASPDRLGNADAPAPCLASSGAGALQLPAAVEPETTVADDALPEQRRRVSPRVSAAGGDASAHGLVQLIDVARTAPDGFRGSVSPSAPLLSPVYETRTPSPTANRKVESANEVRPNGLGIATKSSRRPELQPPPTPARAPTGAEDKLALSDRPNGHTRGSQSSGGSVNGWKPAARGRKGARPVGKKGSPSSSHGEPIPANDSERKGG